MSMHEWNSAMYGIEFPNVKVDGEKILAFIENHKGRFEGEDLPKTAEEAEWYANDFECGEGCCGLPALISFVTGNEYIYAESDEDGNRYIGMFAYTLFPWDYTSDAWASIKCEDIENDIRSLVEELGVDCPEFDTHTIWYWG